MNERIKQLAEQADAYADAMDVGGKDYIGLRDEYFTKLIVKECIDICNEEEADYTKHKKWAYGEEKNLYNEGETVCHRIKFIIKKHFGVEE